MEKGVPVVDKQADMTPFQRQVLVEEFNRQEEEKQKELPEEARTNSGPNTVSGGRRNQSHSSVNSKKQAIKESQEENNQFVNKSVVNNE